MVDLFKSTNTFSMEKAEREDLEVGSLITEVEVAEVVKQLCIGSYPCVDEIHP